MRSEGGDRGDRRGNDRNRGGGDRNRGGNDRGPREDRPRREHNNDNKAEATEQQAPQINSNDEADLAL